MDIQKDKIALESRPWKDSYLQLRREFDFVKSQSDSLEAEWQDLDKAIQMCTDERDALLDLCARKLNVESIDIPQSFLTSLLPSSTLHTPPIKEEIPADALTAADFNLRAAERHKRA